MWLPKGGYDPRASSKKTRIETQKNGKWSGTDYEIRGQVPRKQGLKPLWIASSTIGQSDPRASSKKTRIETFGIKFFHKIIEESEGKFQENKDWNMLYPARNHCTQRSEGKFQENKDWNLHRSP